MTRVAIYGPEDWGEAGGAAWSHWDVWFCFVCSNDFDHDWPALEDAIVDRHRRRSLGGDSWERKVTHLRDLVSRLDVAGVHPRDLAIAITDDARITTKARRKVLEQDLMGRDRTVPMENPPRRWLHRRAMRGHFGGFPVDPAGYVDFFASVVDEGAGGYYRAGDLDTAARDAAAECDSEAELLALWRGLLSAGVEAFLGGLRDSDGMVAEFLGEALQTYLGLPWRSAGVGPRSYWQDLCEWLVWDDWGIASGCQRQLFAQARPDEHDLIESILVGLDEEHSCHRLVWHADTAAQLRAWLAISTDRADRFVAVAERLRADWWMPVYAMADHAESIERPDLAADLLRASITGGGHQVRHLQKRLSSIAG